jgi:dethiobiotin synthetase
LPPATGIFVTGTDTAVGKTLAAATLVRVLATRGHAVVGLKPVASGSTATAEGLRNSDALALAAESSVGLPYELTNPYCFEAAIAPHLAAADAGVRVEMPDLQQWYRRASGEAEFAIVEGAGGWRLPLGSGTFLSDLPERLGLGVIIVVGLRLGCLNHARLTLEAIDRGRGSRFLGWIANDLAEPFRRRDENIETLSRLLGADPIALIPRLPQPDPGTAAAWFDYDNVLRCLRGTVSTAT